MKLGLAYFIQIFIVLFLIIIIFYAGNFLLNFVPGRKNRNQRIKILDYLVLQPQIALYIVAIDKQEYILTISNRVITNFIEKKTSNFEEHLKKEQANHDSGSTDQSKS